MQDFSGQQIDRYRILERLGLGGMAVVYKAYDTRLARDVAIKFIRIGEIPESQHERIRKRFEQEARTQARLNHPNIVPAYDYGEYHRTPYLVIAIVSNGTLKDRISGPMPVNEALAILTPIADAVAYAHQMGVLHRDIKPSNILFAQDGTPVLTDFGIAKLLETTEATLTGTGLGVGTPEYMAPEQWQGRASKASDQYALGVVLFEMLTGKKPYTAETPLAVALKQLHDPLQRPSELNPAIPDRLEKLLYTALAREPGDRFEDVRILHQRLKALSEELQPIEPVIEENPLTATEAELVQTGITAPDPEKSETIDALEVQHLVETHKSSLEPVRKPRWKLPKWALGIAVVLTLTAIASIMMAVLGNPKGKILGAAGAENSPSFTKTANPTKTNTTEPTQTPTYTSTTLPTNTPTQTPTPTPEPPQIQKLNYVNDNYEVKQIDILSREITKLGDIPYDWTESFPINGVDDFLFDGWQIAWSRDGRYMVYSPRSNVSVWGGQFYGEGLFLYDTIETEIKAITEIDNQLYRIIDFSPDNKHLLFISLDNGIPNLFSYNIETEAINSIASWEWDETSLGFVSVSWDIEDSRFYLWTPGSNFLQRYDLETKTFEAFTAFGNNRLYYNLLSPDGDKMLSRGLETYLMINFATGASTEILSEIDDDYNYMIYGWLDNSQIIGAWDSLIGDEFEQGFFRINADDLTISKETIPNDELITYLVPRSLIHIGSDYLLFYEWQNEEGCFIFRDKDTLEEKSHICGDWGSNHFLNLPNYYPIARDRKYFYFVEDQKIMQIDLETQEIITFLETEDTIVGFAEYWE